MESSLIKTIYVPREVIKTGVLYNKLDIYTDRLVGYGNTISTWFFKEYSSVKMQHASLANAYAAIIFITPMNANNYIANGAQVLVDANRINFCSGTFSYKAANEFIINLYDIVFAAFNEYKKNAIQAAQNTVADTHDEDPAEKIKKLKELLDIGAITQVEFEDKKRKLLSEI